MRPAGVCRSAPPGQPSWSTDRTLPAGSLNQAIGGPPSRKMPFSSTPSYRSNWMPSRPVVDRGLDVIHREVQDGVFGRHVLLALRVDQDLLARRQVQVQHPVLLRHRDLQGLAVERLGGGHIVHGEAAERVCRVEHEGSFRGTGSWQLLPIRRPVGRAAGAGTLTTSGNARRAGARSMTGASSGAAGRSGLRCRGSATGRTASVNRVRSCIDCCHLPWHRGIAANTSCMPRFSPRAVTPHRNE